MRPGAMIDNTEDMTSRSRTACASDDSVPSTRSSETPSRRDFEKERESASKDSNRTYHYIYDKKRYNGKRISGDNKKVVPNTSASSPATHSPQSVSQRPVKMERKREGGNQGRANPRQVAASHKSGDGGQRKANQRHNARASADGNHGGSNNLATTTSRTSSDKDNNRANPLTPAPRKSDSSNLSLSVSDSDESNGNPGVTNALSLFELTANSGEPSKNHDEDELSVDSDDDGQIKAHHQRGIHPYFLSLHLQQLHIQQQFMNYAGGATNMWNLYWPSYADQYQRQGMAWSQYEQSHQPVVDYYAIIDVECACERHSAESNFETIEFPAIFLNAHTLNIDFYFHRYVRPTERTKLSAFCQNLTGIHQGIVDASNTLGEVLQEFNTFLEDHKLSATEKMGYRTFLILTDGPWDIQRFIQPECERKGIQMKAFFRRWVNIRRIFMQTVYAGYMGGVPAKEESISLAAMLDATGLQFEGRQHSGIDDARNIARMSAKLLGEGVQLIPNMSIPNGACY